MALHLPARPTYAPLHDYGGLVQRAIILVLNFPTVASASQAASGANPGRLRGAHFKAFGTR